MVGVDWARAWLRALSLLLLGLPPAPPLGVAAASVLDEPAFAAVWERTDRAVEALAGAGRSYTWGPPLAAAAAVTAEPYDGRSRRVAYFDKARMELTRPGAPPDDLFAVTTGLLVRELVTGLRQDGDAAFTPRLPSLSAVAGDPDDGGGNPLAPAYASFQAVLDRAPAPLTALGQPIVERIDRAGRVSAGAPPEERRLAAYDPHTRHYIADVFVAFADQTGPIWDGGSYVDGPVFFGNPVYVLGRPITEPYWTRARVGGVERDVLVQLFERRVLTYTPANPPGWQVEMGNVGQHYYAWRYQTTPRPPATAGLGQLLDLASLPRVGGYTRTGLVSSAEPIGGNIDYGSYRYEEPGRYVIFDVFGPGAVTRLWMTGFPGTRTLAAVGRLQFFFDDEPAPRLDLPATDLFAGRRPPFVPPLVADPDRASGGSVSYVPIPFARRLKIATTSPPAYYQINYQTWAGDQPVHSFTGREDLSWLAQLLSRPGVEPQPAPPDRRWVRGEGVLRPGQELPLGGVLPGPAVINVLRLWADLPNGDLLRHLAIRIQWDGRAPDVDAPLDFFFGSGQGERRVAGLMAGIDPAAHAYYCYFPMPFRQAARVVLINRSGRAVPVRWEIGLDPDPTGRLVGPDSGYFRATFRQERPPRYGDDYVILQATGRGRYVGTVLAFTSDARAMEGDERIYLDGNRTPQHGTGVEDYFNGAWGYATGPYSGPLAGAARVRYFPVPAKPPSPGDQEVPYIMYVTTGAYRFLVGEALTFASSITVAVEHGALGRNKPADGEEYASLALWYGLDEPALRPTDVLYVGDRDSERVHTYRASGVVGDGRLTAQYEGPLDTPKLTEHSRKVAGSSQFRLAIEPDNAGVLLRRQFDYADVNQQADVYVDGQYAGRWSSPGRNEARRWRDEDFVIPARLTRGKPEIEVRLVVVAAPSPWSETAYTAFSLRHALVYLPNTAPLPGG
jgi:hypothetical protein